jgi:hypothetical protein
MPPEILTPAERMQREAIAEFDAIVSAYTTTPHTHDLLLAAGQKLVTECRRAWRDDMRSRLTQAGVL